MEKYLEMISQTGLFDSIEKTDIKALLGCIRARVVEYGKDQLVVEEGSEVYDFGIMLSGHGRVYKQDAGGKVVIITLLKPGSEIGVILAGSYAHKSPVSVRVQEASTVLMVPYDALVARCGGNCPRHDRLLRNFIHIVSEKGLELYERIDCLIKPTVREKILEYLSRVSREQGSMTVHIPLDRYAMSEYLNIERSALSRELSRMRREGVIDFHRNSFRLL